MSKTGSANGSFFGNFIYDRLLQRRSHFLRDLVQTVDFAFIKRALKDFYVDWGRDPWDPVLIFKMVFLQFLYNLSDREIEEQCTIQVVPGLERRGAASGPHHPLSLPGAAGGWRVSGNSSTKWWRRPGSGASSRIASTSSMPPTSPPRWTFFRLKKEHAQGDDDDTYADRNSPDPEARFGRKSIKKGFYGYKAHIVEDAESELIVGVMTTLGNVPDGAVLPQLIDPGPLEVTGDKGYDSAANHAHLEEMGAASGIIAEGRGGPATPAGSGRRWSASLPKEINAIASKRRGTWGWSRSASKASWWPSW